LKITLGFYIFIFIISCFLLFWSGKWLVEALTGMARFLRWKEFVVAFFVMAFAGAAPNLFVGINSALHKIPQLSFGEIVGGNVVDLTLGVALAVLISRAFLPAESRTIQQSLIFTSLVAVLPLILILDGTLGRGDGIILILVFFFYIFWLFSKEERFQKIYNRKEIPIVKEFKVFIKDLGKVVLGVLVLLLASEGIVQSASFFAESLDFPLALIGILVVGLGNALPETYFAVVSAKKGKSEMVLGNLISNIIVPVTFILGIVALICPIKILDFSPFAIGRVFLIISALFFFIFARTDRKITKKEAFFLLGIYILFVLVEILTN
jgi:cation:H+ antiporter